MKKAILMTLAALGLAGMAQAETWNPLSDSTVNAGTTPGSDAGWYFSGNGSGGGTLNLVNGTLQTGKTTDGTFTASGTQWGAPVAWYNLGEAISLTQTQKLSFSLTYTITGQALNGNPANNALVTVGLVGTKQAVVVGSGWYSASGDTDGGKVGFGTTDSVDTTKGYAFKDGSSTEKVADATALTDVTTTAGTAITLDATVAWDATESQFKLTVSSGDSEGSMLIGESFDLSRLTICADDAAGANFNVQISGLALQVTPEPTTATLSLLALAGLCARRRRK